MGALPDVAHTAGAVRPAVRAAWADNLKVVLVAGVIVAHTTMAWTHVGNWVFQEPVVREPLLTLLVLVTAVVALFGMPLFFLVAGYFTPRSLERKGFARFVGDRALRLLVPMLAFVVLLSPPIEFVDPGNVGWAGDFWSFVPHILWPPAPGPTWFLGVLFAFSVGYAALRAGLPARRPASPLRWWHLMCGTLAVAVASFPIMIAAPLGMEVWRLAVAQAPGWLMGFALGVLARERGWVPIERRLARTIRWTAWLGMAAATLVFSVGSISGMDMELFLGGGTWQSALVALVEGVVVVFTSLWLVDLFQRRLDHQGPRGRVLSRAAFGAFLVHQGVLVALVLGSRVVSWPPEAAYVVVSTLGVAMSFAIGWLLTRIPGIRRIV